MKKVVFYFDPRVKKIYEKKVDENGETRTVLSSIHNFVYTAEIVARTIDIQDDSEIKEQIDPGYSYFHVVDNVPLKSDSGIIYDQNTAAYRATEYGFVVYEGGKLKLLSPLQVTRDKLKAYMTVYPTKSGRVPGIKDIEDILKNYSILAGLGQKKIEEQLDAIDKNKPGLMRILVAQGKAPVNGHDEYYVPLLDVDKKAGEILSDGRIDFKEKGSIIQIVKNQEVLERIPEVKPVDGYNIYGDKAPSEIEEPAGYRRGENIVQSGHDENIFLSSIDGCIEAEGRTISVLPIVVIRGDVAYETGNIDFNGSVHIFGSVLPGFSVKATGDIIINNNVDDALIKADGDIIVKMGVVGKESARLVSGGRVTAKFLLNAQVEASGEIIVEDSIINSTVFSNKSISVVAKHGKIIGGKATALYSITVKVSGAINETETVLSVGRNLDIERELQEVNREIGRWRELVAETMRKLKVNFGEGVFENPKEYIAILPPVKKKNCLVLLKELNSSNRELKQFMEKSKEIQQKLNLEQEPVIVVKDKIYPGTVLNIKKSVRKIDRPLDNVRFFEDAEDKLIRFTSAI